MEREDHLEIRDPVDIEENKMFINSRWVYFFQRLNRILKTPQKK